MRRYYREISNYHQDHLGRETKVLMKLDWKEATAN